jgi:hypothetical protein
LFGIDNEGNRYAYVMSSEVFRIFFSAACFPYSLFGGHRPVFCPSSRFSLHYFPFGLPILQDGAIIWIAKGNLALSCCFQEA